MGRPAREFSLPSGANIFHSDSIKSKQAALVDPIFGPLLLENGYEPGKGRANPWKDRPFVGWDGEGITPEGKRVQNYVLFGCSTGRYRKSPDLGTKECLDLMIEVESENPDAIHVGFSFKYDVNMILKDLPFGRLLFLFRNNYVKWEGYRLEYYPGKWFRVRKGPKGSTTCQLFDVFGFFQSSFVHACEDFLGKNDPDLVGIREGKSRRKQFTYADLDNYVIPYWRSELEMLVRLMESLRGNLQDAGIRLTSWHGAGAVANSIFGKHRVKEAMNESSPEIRRAAQYGYAGGRFELFKCGYSDNPVWEYDINSAYPSAIAELPSLSGGHWRFTRTFEPGSFSIWHIRYRESERTNTIPILPQPLFCRHKGGHVSFPQRTIGWYWEPEANLVPDFVEYGWVFDPANDDKPFAFVPEMYETRRQWKEQGINAQLAYKLGLNSIYGKMAQRVGGNKNQAPKYHQLEWAGYVTSKTRAKLFAAISIASVNVIAAETDAIFSTQPIPGLTLGTGLGQWKETKFDAICYLQNGFYFALEKGEWHEKYRGFDEGSISLAKVKKQLRLTDLVEARRHSGLQSPPVPRLKGTTTRFIGFGIALHTNSIWRSWEQDKRRYIDIGGGTKRRHITSLCSECRRGEGLSESLHTLTAMTIGGKSHPHTLPWLLEDSFERFPWELDPYLDSF